MEFEVLATSHHESCVVSIHIAHEEPCAYAVVGNVGTILLVEQRLIVVEQSISLVIGVALGIHHAHSPDVLVAVMSHHSGMEGVSTIHHLSTLYHIEPQGEFAAIEWRLLYEGYGAGIAIMDKGHLIG